MPLAFLTLVFEHLGMQWRHYAFIILIGFSLSSWAQGKINPIVWYKPFYYAVPASNSLSVTLFGKTNPKTSVAVDLSQVVTANPANDAQPSAAKMATTISNQSGEFKLSLELPKGYVQLPVEVTADNAEKAIYILTLEVADEKLNISVKTEEDTPRIADWRKREQDFIELQYGLGLPMNDQLKGLWISGALGINYQTYSQSLSGNTQLSFNSLSSPSLGLHATYAESKWLVNLSYARTPGKVGSATPPFTIDQTNYVWTTTKFEYGLNSQQQTYREKARLTYLIGLQQHLEPSFTPTFGNLINQQSVQLTNLSLGSQIWAKVSNTMLLDFGLHYQYPLEVRAVSRNGFKISPQYFFDGSIGLYRELTKNRYLGLVWFGQWHRYRFSYNSDINGTSWTGDQNLFYTNLDLRFVSHF